MSFDRSEIRALHVGADRFRITDRQTGHMGHVRYLSANIADARGPGWYWAFTATIEGMAAHGGPVETIDEAIEILVKHMRKEHK